MLAGTGSGATEGAVGTGSLGAGWVAEGVVATGGALVAVAGTGVGVSVGTLASGTVVGSSADQAVVFASNRTRQTLINLIVIGYSSPCNILAYSQE